MRALRPTVEPPPAFAAPSDPYIVGRHPHGAQAYRAPCDGGDEIQVLIRCPGCGKRASMGGVLTDDAANDD
jgi:hypothetical protein